MSNRKKPTWIAVIIMAVAFIGTIVALQITQGRSDRHEQGSSPMTSYSSKGVQESPFRYLTPVKDLEVASGGSVWQVIHDELQSDPISDALYQALKNCTSNDICFYNEAEEEVGVVHEDQTQVIVDTLQAENPDLDLNVVQPGFTIYRDGDRFRVRRDDLVGWGEI